MANRISIDTSGIEWQPASDVFAGYRLENHAGAQGDADDGDDTAAGIFVRVLRRPADGGDCWHCLLRFRPPAGRAIRITAVAESDEEVFIVDTDRAGQY